MLQAASVRTGWRSGESWDNELFNKAAIRKNALPCLVLVGLAVARPVEWIVFADSFYWMSPDLTVQQYFLGHLLLVALGAVLCQGSLAVAWIVCGNQRLWKRIVTILLATIVISIVYTCFQVILFLLEMDAEDVVLDASLVQQLIYGFTDELIMPILHLFFAITALLLLLGFVQISVKRLRRMGVLPTEQWQYSIRWLFGITTAIAVLLALGRGLFPGLDWGAALRDFLQACDTWSLTGIVVRTLLALPILLVFLAPWRARTIVITCCVEVMLLAVGRIFAMIIIEKTVFFSEFFNECFYSLLEPNVTHIITLTTSLYILRRAGWLRVSGQTNTAPLAYSTAAPLHVDS